MVAELKLKDPVLMPWCRQPGVDPSPILSFTKVEYHYGRSNGSK